MRRLVQFFASDESRGAAIKYGVIAAAIAVAIVIVLGQVGGQLDTAFNTRASGSETLMLVQGQLPPNRARGQFGTFINVSLRTQDHCESPRRRTRVTGGLSPSLCKRELSAARTTSRQAR